MRWRIFLVLLLMTDVWLLRKWGASKRLAKEWKFLAQVRAYELRIATARTAPWQDTD